MKKVLLGLGLILTGISAFSQRAIEGVIVEKIPVPATATEVASGATAYRVFIDMAPGAVLSAVASYTGNPMEINTTTTFYNYYDAVNEVAFTFGSELNAGVINHASGRYDSYIALNWLGTSRVMVPTSEDNIGDVDGILTSQTGAFGVGTVGTPFFHHSFWTNTRNSYFSETAIWNVAGGGNVTGPFATNRVFIGQFTTDGDFSFKFSVQVNDTVYTSTNNAPAPNWVYYPALAQAFGKPQTTLTHPTQDTTITSGNPVVLRATSIDPDGSVTKVNFYRTTSGSTSLIGSDTDGSDGWSYNWTNASVGTHNITAKGVDNGNGEGQSSNSRKVTVNPAPVNDPPVITSLITDKTSYAWGEDIIITATVSDPQGANTVTKVDFYIDGQ
ncbi:MAG: hypothetical protein HC906_13880 [Bacteroidales bacterium]|nr:hypothetical protein [Bacteroidales bacterium]